MEKNNILTDLPLELTQNFKRISDTHLECITCHSKLKYTKKQGVTPLKAHLKMDKHLKALDVSVTSCSAEDTFHHDLLEAMISCNISLNVFDNRNFKNFIEKHCKRRLYCRTTYIERILEELYKSRLESKKKSLEGKDFYMSFDETPDVTGRKVVNIMVGELSELGYIKPFILNTFELDTVNGETIKNKILFEVYKLIEKEDFTANFKLLLSDAAPYCILAGKKLMEIFPELKHVTCLAHALHNFLETIRGNCLGINKLFSAMKKVFTRIPKAKKLLKARTNLKQLKFPVITRWGTWINFVEVLYENFTTLDEFFNGLQQKKTVERVVKLLRSTRLEEEFEFAKQYFTIAKMISELETQGLSVPKQNFDNGRLPVFNKGRCLKT